MSEIIKVIVIKEKLYSKVLRKEKPRHGHGTERNYCDYRGEKKIIVPHARYMRSGRSQSMCVLWAILTFFGLYLKSMGTHSLI